MLVVAQERTRKQQSPNHSSLTPMLKDPQGTTQTPRLLPLLIGSQVVGVYVSFVRIMLCNFLMGPTLQR